MKIPSLILLLFISLPKIVQGQTVHQDAANSICDCMSKVDGSGRGQKVIIKFFEKCIDDAMAKNKEKFAKAGVDIATMNQEEFGKVMKEVPEICRNRITELRDLSYQREQEFNAIQSQKICACLDKHPTHEGFKSCMGEVLTANLKEIYRLYDVDNEFKAILAYGPPINSVLTDNCPAFLEALGVNAKTQYNPVKEDCQSKIRGVYSFEDLLRGTVKISIVENKYTEFSKDGSIFETYDIEWNGCDPVFTIKEVSEESKAHAGDQFIIKIKRASEKGFIGFVGKDDDYSMREFERLNEEPIVPLSAPEFMKKYSDMVCDCRQKEKAKGKARTFETCISTIMQAEKRNIKNYYTGWQDWKVEMLFSEDMKFGLIGKCGPVLNEIDPKVRQKFLSERISAVCDCYTRKEDQKTCVVKIIQKDPAISAFFGTTESDDTYHDFMPQMYMVVVDQCPAASEALRKGMLNKYKIVLDGCSSSVIGNYEYKPILAEKVHQVTFTGNRYTEYNDDGSILGDYELKWENCSAMGNFISGDEKKAESHIKFEVRRISDTGFVALKGGGILQYFDEYIKVK